MPKSERENPAPKSEIEKRVLKSESENRIPNFGKRMGEIKVREAIEFDRRRIIAKMDI